MICHHFNHFLCKKFTYRRDRFKNLFHSFKLQCTYGCRFNDGLNKRKINEKKCFFLPPKRIIRTKIPPSDWQAIGKLHGKRFEHSIPLTSPKMNYDDISILTFAFFLSLSPHIYYLQRKRRVTSVSHRNIEEDILFRHYFATCFILCLRLTAHTFINVLF